MEKIRTLAVDDEPLALDLVKEYIEQTPFLEFCGCCSSASEAMERLSRGDVRLAFLDIQMPDFSGIALAKALPAQNRPRLVFTTAFADYALDGFRLDAVGYLLKPFDYGEFLHEASKARELIASELAQQPAAAPDFFFVRSEYRLVRINPAEIVYVEGLKDYIKIYLSTAVKPVLTLMSLKQMEQRLPSSQFVRVHRSFIVNVGFVVGVERNLIHLPAAKVPMGDGYKQQMMSIIEKYTV